VRFTKLFEQLLCEMPYIEVGKQIIDLEVEKYKNTPETFILILQKILQGKTHIDKYNNTMQLTSLKDKEEFIKKIKLNHIIRGIIPGNLIDSL
jgi:hypothetical protein